MKRTDSLRLSAEFHSHAVASVLPHYTNTYYINIKIKNSVVYKMDQRVKVHNTKHDDLSSVPGSHIIEGNN